MLTVRRIYLNNNYSSATLVRWDVADTLETMDDYAFNIYTSPSPTTEFSKVNDVPVLGLSYMYRHPHIYDASVKYYFRIEVLNIVTNEALLCDEVGAMYLTPADPVADTIIYQNEVLLKHVLGRPPVKLLIKRRSGTRCTSCWDPELMEVTKSSCVDCYSVGYAGGYLPPEDIYISFTEPGFLTKFDIADVRDTQQAVTQAWCSNYPLVLPGDIIVDEFNRRFIIIQVQPTTKSGQIYLRQLLQLQLLPPTDVVYKLEL